MTEKRSKHSLLTSLLASLLQEWDYDTVRQCLADLHAEQGTGGALLAAQDSKRAKERRHSSASEIVDRLNAAEARKALLRALAARFDAKTFLPSASDVRHFIGMLGQDPGLIKHRQDSFRKVLEVLDRMADDKLQFLQESGAYAGPTQLGPLSDAIKATSAAVRPSKLYVPPTAAEDLSEQAGFEEARRPTTR